MLILRSLIFTIGQWLFTPVFTIVALLTFPFSRINRNKIISLWARSMLWWLRVTCNITYELKGAENIPATPCVILAKHQSAWETLAFQLIFPPQVYVMKRELLWIPFFGWGLAMTSPIAINRGAGREALKQLVKLGKQRLASGLWVVVFPEGTRIAPGLHSKFHIGGAWLASGSKATVLPVAHNAGLHWAKNTMLKRPGVITVSVGQSFDCSNLKPEAINTQVETWIKAEMTTLNA
ncbi:MAG: lysophospholipid acyltransferase family protein [Pseudomonadota bacterium]